jgi:hypothetical protein
LEASYRFLFYYQIFLGTSRMRTKLGATKDFPEGKLNEQDKGGLALAVGAYNGKVIIDFGEPVS